jgi:hypothetical protein
MIVFIERFDFDKAVLQAGWDKYVSSIQAVLVQ